MDKPVGVNLLGDSASARCEAEQSHDLRLHIGGKFWERARRHVDASDLQGCCHAHTVLVPIQCHACLDKFIGNGGELRPRNPLDIDIAFRDSRCCHEGASRNIVGDDGVFGAAEMFHAVNCQHCRSDAFNIRAHSVEESGQIADMRFAGGTPYDGCPLCQRGSHHHVRRCADARAVLSCQIHFRAD